MPPKKTKKRSDELESSYEFLSGGPKEELEETKNTPDHTIIDIDDNIGKLPEAPKPNWFMRGVYGSWAGLKWTGRGIKYVYKRCRRGGHDDIDPDLRKWNDEKYDWGNDQDDVDLGLRKYEAPAPVTSSSSSSSQDNKEEEKESEYRGTKLTKEGQRYCLSLLKEHKNLVHAALGKKYFGNALHIKSYTTSAILGALATVPANIIFAAAHHGGPKEGGRYNQDDDVQNTYAVVYAAVSLASLAMRGDIISYAGAPLRKYIPGLRESPTFQQNLIDFERDVLAGHATELVRKTMKRFFQSEEVYNKTLTGGTLLDQSTAVNAATLTAIGLGSSPGFGFAAFLPIPNLIEKMSGRLDKAMSSGKDRFDNFIRAYTTHPNDNSHSTENKEEINTLRTEFDTYKEELTTLRRRRGGENKKEEVTSSAAPSNTTLDPTGSAIAPRTVGRKK